MRRLLAAFVVLSACAGPPSANDPYDPDPYEPPPVEEAGLDGLTSDQRASLRGLPFPALVPGDVGAFALDRFAADSDGRFGNYALGYRRADGACFEVSGANEGLGGPEYPIVSTAVTIRDLGRTIRLYKAGDDPRGTSAQVWGVGTIVSEFVELDGAGILFLSDTQGGCRPLSLEEAAEFVADLRRLPDGPASSAVSSPRSTEPTPPTDPAALGPFAPADDLLADYNAASTPEVAAEALARRYDADEVRIEALEETSYEATVLVTALGLRDDSVRDERLRLTYAPYGPTWELVAAGRQTRCQPGRGHQDWSDGRCS
ncbi:hypothetical protein [Rubrivirga marina]|uniref:Uncharacterized protein n=1 Tax=Rubrivirga marina TaxID=1196024 RepID=A0A271IVP1_9BACT|nr:hypothetical protein [Rubrivirga marina]PAP75180.1 hypothetical protein BSZ37_01340 [Rubrivirga marina]